MNPGKYKVAQQINNRGIFAEIELEAALHFHSSIVKIEYEFEIDRIWQAGIEFGIKYFIEHLQKPYAKGIQVKVTRFNYNEVDTKMALVSIVTIKALMDAYKATIYREPFIDFKNFMYCFPF